MSQTTYLRSLRDSLGNAQSFFDFITGETLLLASAASSSEDFVGPGHAIPPAGSPATNYTWVQRTQQTAGAPSVAALPNFSGGAVRLALDGTSEKQEATLYANDFRNWDMTKCAIFEARISNHVIPTGVVEMVFGLHSAWIDGPDNASYYADFQQLGSGAVNFRTKDGVNTLSYPSGIVLTADSFNYFRIDATNPANVRFFINGVEVSNSGQMSFQATGANAVLQPYFSVYKPSGTGLATLDVDKVMLAMNRS